MSRFQLKAGAKTPRLSISVYSIQAHFLFVNYVVDGNRKKNVSVMQINTTLSHYCRPSMIWKFECLGVSFAN